MKLRTCPHCKNVILTTRQRSLLEVVFTKKRTSGQLAIVFNCYVQSMSNRLKYLLNAGYVERYKIRDRNKYIYRVTYEGYRYIRYLC